MFQQHALFLALISLLLCDVSLAQHESVKLEAYKRIDKPARTEVSGIAKSRQFKNVFWVHGDSGTENAIFAINENGEIVSEDKDYEGTEILGAKNIDWEDIALGSDSTLLIADTGNNCFCRDNLSIIVIPEPKPDAVRIYMLKHYYVRYPSGEGLSSLVFDKVPDAESVFMLNGSIHVLTKEARTASLFRLDNPVEDKMNQLVEVDQFEFKERITAADVSPDGTLLAVLSHQRLWVFELDGSETPLQNRYSETRLRGAKQIESITFSGEDLIIVEEEGEMYRVPLKDLSKPGEN